MRAVETWDEGQVHHDRNQLLSSFMLSLSCVAWMVMVFLFW